MPHGYVGAVNFFVVRVWLPDRPGALGQVAGRIGGVHGDVLGIEILERGGGSAVDELVVSVPDDVTLQVLVAAIAQVDGVAVEDVRPIDPNRPDHGMAALESAAVLAETSADERLERFCDQLRELVDGTWAVAMGADPGDDTGLITLVERGLPPDTAWLAAFLEGSRHLPAGTHGESSPGDVVWVHLDAAGVSVAAGRSDRPFHARERQQVALLGRLADALLRR
ncbi:unannotated protein [freshwater metagenome]|uniref:Unannotated protein n=1 Tax=freshwater metagenome TaxID=449393 RepID=A0A6J7E4N7_9ZZZZ|nr:hypothetical protein [Actinomycetota bacterium]